MTADSLLLLSGGLDSTALAAWTPPAAALTIDYGQVCAAAELSSARRICDRLGIEHVTAVLRCDRVGAGLLAGDAVDPEVSNAEFWPFRNQLLITVAAAVAYERGVGSVTLGAVRSDGERHIDGSRSFVEAISALCAMQEGGVSVTAPAVDLTTAELIENANVSMDLLGWTHSCHTGNVACGRCPGCWKRSTTFREMGHPL